MADSVHKQVEGLQSQQEPRRWLFPLMMAMVLLIAFACLYFARAYFNPQPKTVGTGTYAAGSQPRSLALDDGSLLKLDIGAQLTVSMNDRERLLRLERGRAIFDVAPERNRLFTVRAGDVEVVAAGTRFQVDLSAEQVQVVLTEGTVLVSSASVADPTPIKVIAREELVYTAAQKRWSKQTVDPEPLTSWALGYHIFDATPLAQALEEINRYSERKILLADAALGALPFSGSFKTGDTQAIVAALSSALPVRVEQSTDSIKVLPR